MQRSGTEGEKNMSIHTIEAALRLALDVHEGQVDKQGKPYILHPVRVMLAVLREQPPTGWSEEWMAVAALLHDVVEDSANRVIATGNPELTPEVTLGEISIEFGQPMAFTVDCLTRRKVNPDEQEPYEEYIDRVATDAVAKQIKIADLRDNLFRMSGLSAEDQARLRPRYEKALARLGGQPILLANQCNCSGVWHDIGGPGCTMKASAAPSGAQARCPKCGDGDLALQVINYGNLFCGKCQFRFTPKRLIDFAQFFSSPSAPQDSKPSCHICGEGMDKGFICGKCGAHTGVAQAAPAGLEERVSSPRSALSATDFWREYYKEDPNFPPSETACSFAEAYINRLAEAASPRIAEARHRSHLLTKDEAFKMWEAAQQYKVTSFNEWYERFFPALPSQPSPAPELQPCKPNSIMKQVMWCDTHNRSYCECKNELESGSSQPSEGPQERTKS